MVNAIMYKGICFCLILARFGGYCQDFGYDGDEGPTHWGDKYAQCVGKHQSPIDIETNKVKHKKFPALQFRHFDEPLDAVELENNGHTVAIKVVTDPIPTLQGGPLKGVYRFSQLHFHWGPNDTVGSENRINHRSYPLELHLVMYNGRYTNQSEAVKHPDGLTVLSFLFLVSKKDNENYDKFEDGLREVQPVSSNKTILNFVPLDKLASRNRDIYFTYEGSLTTPPCSEVVTWIEFIDTVPLSKEQINTFRSLLTSHGQHLTHNYRPIQPINDRIVYYNGISPSTSTNSLYIIIGLLTSFYLGNFKLLANIYL